MRQLKMQLTEKIIEKFWAKVDKKSDDECWNWTASMDRHGYGQIGVNYKNYRTHRIAWVIHSGEIPEGLCVCHKCDNPACVNPAHLFLGTLKDNAVDRSKKCRGVSPDNTGERNGRHKITEKDVIAIRLKYAPYIYSACKLAKEYGVTTTTIYRIVKYKTWKHIEE